MVIRRSRVVLPAPFGPMRPTIWSRRNSKPTSFTAVKPPKRLVRCSIVKNGADMLRCSRAKRRSDLSASEASAELAG